MVALGSSVHIEAIIERTTSAGNELGYEGRDARLPVGRLYTADLELKLCDVKVVDPPASYRVGASFACRFRYAAMFTRCQETVNRGTKMRLGKLVQQITLAGTIAIWASVASATSITLSFSGVLTNTFGSLSAGDAFSGSYTFDPTIAANAGSNSTTAVFDNLLSATLTVGAFSATVGPGVGLAEIQQGNNEGGTEDRYSLAARNAVGSSQIGGLDLTLFGFRLDDTTQSAIADALTLLTNPSLGSFTSASFFMFFGQPTSPDFTVVEGTFTSLTIPQVPEPATWALLALGLVAIGFVRASRSA